MVGTCYCAQLTHIQQCFCHLRHFFCLFAEKPEKIRCVRRHFGMFGSKQLKLRLHQRQRCAQLMGGIPGELALRSKTVIQTVQHSVEGAAEFLKLRQHIFGELHI